MISKTPPAHSGPPGPRCWHVGLLCLLCLLPVRAAGTDPEARREFANPPLRFMPRPLWFWNNTGVAIATVQEQMRLARDRCRYGGFGILPFGPQFSPAYLSDDYFAVYGAALEQAKALGLTLSLYDEYGFPSGSAGAQNSSATSLFARRWPGLTIKRLDKHEHEITGPARYAATLPAGHLAAVVALNPATFQRLDLTDSVRDGRLEWSAPAGAWKVFTFVCVPDGDPICDYLDPEAADRFIELTHQAYYDRFAPHFGTTIDSTFFDEPTLYRAQGRTWTEKFNEKFQARHGFNPRPYYPALWYDIGPETQAARNYLFGFRAELYATGFAKRIQDWSAAHGIAATGHQDQEEVLNPVSVSGDLMKCFQHLAIPGIDKIGGDRPAERFYKVVSSAAYNWDKSLVMSETYGAMGDLTWDELYAVALEQYTKGINLLIPHAVWYDETNVTFKPELSWRHPRYAERLPEFNTFLARLNWMLQNDDAHVADIAVLYPIATLQGSHHLDGPLGHYLGGVAVPEADYIEVGELLSVTLGRDFTFLHPEVLEEQCVLEAGQLRLPNRVHPGRFPVLIVPGHKTISWRSLQKIQAFYEQGGCVIATGQLPFKSAEFGHDQDVARVREALFGPASPHPVPAAILEVRRNAHGGCAIRLLALNAASLQAALDTAQPAYDVAFEPGKAMRYIHKVRDGRHVFFIANLDPALAETVVTLRGRHRLEAWDPHTGTIQPMSVTHTNLAGTDLTRVQLPLPHLQSRFLVSAPDAKANWAEQSDLPSGPGLAAQFPGDAGLKANEQVIFADDFESGGLGEGWDETGNKDGRVLAFAVGDARAGLGERCLRVEAHLGQDTGGGLTKWFEPADPVFIRFYTKFDPACDYVHHFVTLRANKGLRGGDKWSGFGGAGLKPEGSERFSTAIEPWGDWGRWAPPGRWNFYSYWHEMEPSRDGKYWGNSFGVSAAPLIPRDRWICVEFMLRHNTPGRPDGEQAFWIDGALQGHWKGINWRKTEPLKANALTLESYVTDRWTKNPVNVVYFDNVVIARGYIGPVAKSEEVSKVRTDP